MQNRPVKLLHRSVLSSDPNEMRKILDLAKLTRYHPGRSKIQLVSRPFNSASPITYRQS